MGLEEVVCSLGRDPRKQSGTEIKAGKWCGREGGERILLSPAVLWIWLCAWCCLLCKPWFSGFFYSSSRLLWVALSDGGQWEQDTAYALLLDRVYAIWAQKPELGLHRHLVNIYFLS